MFDVAHIFWLRVNIGGGGGEIARQIYNLVDDYKNHTEIGLYIYINRSKGQNRKFCIQKSKLLDRWIHTQLPPHPKQKPSKLLSNALAIPLNDNKPNLSFLQKRDTNSYIMYLKSNSGYIKIFTVIQKPIIPLNGPMVSSQPDVFDDKFEYPANKF